MCRQKRINRQEEQGERRRADETIKTRAEEWELCIDGRSIGCMDYLLYL